MAAYLPTTEQKKKRKIHQSLWFWKFLSFCLFLLLIGCFFRQAVDRLYTLHPIIGTSMTPSIKQGSQVLISKKAKPIRYSIISFSVNGEETKYIKRVVGIPGDTFFIEGTRLVLDLDGTGNFQSTYSVDISETQAKEWKQLRKIPEDAYFVLGDNLSVSKDSRMFGWVKASDIEGTVLFK